jgi:uncharacterized cysteine cluster protein YcgN (CxxCxxCC family)
LPGEEQAPYWKTKRLEEMSREEWEGLCDGCARCCLIKLEDEDTGDIHLTRLACKLLSVKSCRCTRYSERFAVMSDCVDLTPDKIATIKWLPVSCAYRRVADGRDLAWWHPLISGDPDTVHQAGISVKSFAMSEARVKEVNYSRYIIDDFEPA